MPREEAVTEAVNDTLKAIAASLLMEQVLAPRFEFKPKNPNNGPTPGLDYGEGGYDPEKCNVGVNHDDGPNPTGDQRTGRTKKSGGRANLPRGLERTHHRIRPRQADNRKRHIR